VLTFSTRSLFVESDIIHLNAAGISLIILDSAEAANDLFEKRSSNYSSRCVVAVCRFPNDEPDP
jgi:hypothetical protein